MEASTASIREPLLQPTAAEVYNPAAGTGLIAAVASTSGPVTLTHGAGATAPVAHDDDSDDNATLELSPLGNFFAGLAYTATGLAGDLLFAWLLRAGGGLTIQSIVAMFGGALDTDTANDIALSLAVVDTVALTLNGYDIPGLVNSVYKIWKKPNPQDYGKIARRLSKTEKDSLESAIQLALENQDQDRLVKKIKFWNTIFCYGSWVVGSFAPFIAFANSDSMLLKIGLALVYGWLSQMILYVATAGSKPQAGANNIAQALKVHKKNGDPTFSDYQPFASPALFFAWVKSMINCTVRALTFAYLSVEIFPSFSAAIGSDNDAFNSFITLSHWPMFLVGFVCAFGMNFTTQSAKELNAVATKHHQGESYVAPIFPHMPKESAPSLTAWRLESIGVFMSFCIRTLGLPAFIYLTFNRNLPDGSLIPKEWLIPGLVGGAVAYLQWPGFLLEDGARGIDYLAKSTVWSVAKLSGCCTSSAPAESTQALVINDGSSQPRAKGCCASLFGGGEATGSRQDRANSADSTGSANTIASDSGIAFGIPAVTGEKVEFAL